MSFVKRSGTIFCNVGVEQASPKFRNSTQVQVRGLHKSVKRVFLVRHGESEGNRDPKVFATIPNAKQRLTSKGRLQSIRAAREIQSQVGNEPVRFLVSPYQRCKETYEYMYPYFRGGHSVREDQRLREQCYGNCPNPYSILARKSERNRTDDPYSYKFEHGESGIDVTRRLESFMDTWKEDWLDTKCNNHIVVSHGVTLRLLLASIFKWDTRIINGLVNLENCEVVTLERPMYRKDDGFYAYHSKLFLTTIPATKTRDLIPEPDIWQERVLEMQQERMNFRSRLQGTSLDDAICYPEIFSRSSPIQSKLALELSSLREQMSA